MSARMGKSRERLEDLLREIASDADQAVGGGRLTPANGSIVARMKDDLKTYTGYMDEVLSVIEAERGEGTADWAYDCLRKLLFASFGIGRHGTVNESALAVIELAEEGARRANEARRRSAKANAGRVRLDLQKGAAAEWARDPTLSPYAVAKVVRKEGDEISNVIRAIEHLAPPTARRGRRQKKA